MSKKHKQKKDDRQTDEIVDEIGEPCEEEVTEVSEVDELKAQLKDLEDKYLRNNADFENIKRRMEKEKMMAISYAHEQFARDMLPIIDALEMAANISDVEEGVSTEELLEKVKEGVNLTIEQFRKTFEKHGIELVNIDGVFDPNFHEAVMQIESDEKPAGNILQVFQKGYKIKDRVLRPAMVSIVK
jgi:molecular chaperone GrpE